MTLKLITPNERLVYRDASGAVFYYRRIAADEYRTIERVKTVRGFADFEAIGLEVLQRCVIDWEGVVDDDGKPVPFSPDKIVLIPGTILNLLFIEIRSNSGIASDELQKN